MPDDVITPQDNAARAKDGPVRRHGPQPMDMHVYVTAFMLSAAAWPWARKPEYHDKVIGVLADLSAGMKQGLQDYQNAFHKAHRMQQHVIWQEGSTRLLLCPQKKPGRRPPVFLVPSLINRADVLDLDAGHSFTAFLMDRGFDVYTLDWGAPQDAETAFTIDDYILSRLNPALGFLQQKTGQASHVIGYCMGGTIAAGAISVLKDQKKLVRSLTLLAAPWDFHAGDALVKPRMHAYLANAEPVMLAKGVLPVDWIQMLFASIDPLFVFNKFRAFAAMDKNTDEARRFVIVEDWLNDGVNMTAPAARQALQEWYIDNQPFNGVWTIGKGLVDTALIEPPVLVVAATGDRLVCEASASAFASRHTTTITPDIGHIGMMASNRAIAEVWQPVADWLKQR